MDFSVVVPVYRGENTLRPLTEQVFAFFAQAGLGSAEIIFVWDCGPDRSWSVIQELRAAYGAERIRAVRLARNFGQHNALICGFAHARGRFVVTMDEDLQHRPEDIARLVARQREGDFDVVYGRYHARQHSGFRNLTSRALQRLLRWGLPDLHPDYSAFRLIKAPVARQCLAMRNSYTFLDGYLTWVTSHVASTEVVHQARGADRSSYSFGKLVEHSVNIFITFSDLPVRLLSLTGVLVFCLTTLYSGYLTVRKLVFQDLLPGYASLMIAIGLGVGLILLGMGILGEYLRRINQKTTQHPPFVEAQRLLDDVEDWPAYPHSE